MTDAQEETLRSLLNNIAGEQGYNDPNLEIHPISSGGANYTSALFLATISAPNKKDLKLFAKIASVGENFRSQMPTDIFVVEQYCYTILAKIFDEIQDKYEVPKEYRLVMPKLYGYNKTYLQETIILEDLTAEGYTNQDRLVSITWEYASKTLEELAKMHALSIVFQEEYPEEFEKASKVLKLHDYENNKELMNTMQNAVIKTIAMADEENREALQKFVTKLMDPEFQKVFTGPQRRPVLAHGDFKISNMMHKYLPDGKADVVIIDYQCVHVGTGMRDVLNFLFSGTDEQFRAKHFHQLLEHYYEKLCSTLRRLNRDPEVTFPREDFDYELEKVKPFGLIVAVFVLPIVTVEFENAPKVDDELSLDSIASLKTSDLCQRRVNEVMRDCIRWGYV